MPSAIIICEDTVFWKKLKQAAKRERKSINEYVLGVLRGALK